MGHVERRLSRIVHGLGVGACVDEALGRQGVACACGQVERVVPVVVHGVGLDSPREQKSNSVVVARSNGAAKPDVVDGRQAGRVLPPVGAAFVTGPVLPVNGGFVFN